MSDRSVERVQQISRDSDAPVRLLGVDGVADPAGLGDEYQPYIDALSDDALLQMHRDMVLTRAFDTEATALQRQGQLALWIPSIGQEAAQVGSGRAARADDFIFPAYREHAVARIRGVDLVDILALLRGVTTGGWNPQQHRFNLYTLVIGSQALHATGYAMGITLDREAGRSRDEAVLAYFGDGATSQGDVSEAFVFSRSFDAPVVFFLQNNHWAISVPVSVQSPVPLYLRSRGFGIPSVQVDGNDVLASYAVTARMLDAARAGEGPRFIEALTYRVGAHTSSDDPTKYEDAALREQWIALDPIPRYAAYLRGRGVSESFFASLDQESKDLAADIRRRTLALHAPAPDAMFTHVYADPHPVTASQQQWLAQYEAGFEGAGA